MKRVWRIMQGPAPVSVHTKPLRKCSGLPLSLLVSTCCPGYKLQGVEPAAGAPQRVAAGGYAKI